MIYLPIFMVLLALLVWSVIPAGSRTALLRAAKPAPRYDGPVQHDGPLQHDGQVQHEKLEAPPAPTALVDDGSPLWTTRDDRQLERLLKRAARVAGSDSTAPDAAQDAP